MVPRAGEPRYGATIKPSPVSGLGGCVATDRVTVDDAPVRFMQREVTDREGDSGWVFFAGDESQAYMDDPENLAVCDVNTIADESPARSILASVTRS